MESTNGTLPGIYAKADRSMLAIVGDRQDINR